MKIFIIIPAFQEAKRIGAVIKDVKKSKLPIIVVDDGSKDNTFDVAKRHNISVIRHAINLGKGAAMKTGAEAAFSMGADAVIFMDSDGQHKVKNLPLFIKALEKKHDIVFGSRNLSQGAPLIRYLGNKFASFFVSLLFGLYISDILCGYRGLSKEGYKRIRWDSRGYGVETEMVARAAIKKLKYCEVPVETVYYDEVKGVTILDSFGIFFDVLRWRITL